jgi:hypothetical protein
MRIRVTSISLPAGLGGLGWEFVAGDRELARETIIFLEDRRVLYGIREIGDEKDCVSSAMLIRRHLSSSIAAAKPGHGLEKGLRGMRAACKEFVTKAGPGAVRFRGMWGGGDNFFGESLNELRYRMGGYIGVIMNKYDLDIEEQLESILPSQETDLSWLPGFGGN